MKKKISLGIIVVAVLVAVYFMFAPSPVNEQRLRESAEVKAPAAPAQAAPATTEEQAPVENDEAALQARMTQMRTEYAMLEKERDALQKQLDDLRADLFEVKLPAQQAKDVNQQLMSAYLLLQNPPMLGAFSSVTDIDHEIDKVKAAQQNLAQVSKAVAAGKGSK